MPLLSLLSSSMVNHSFFHGSSLYYKVVFQEHTGTRTSQSITRIIGQVTHERIIESTAVAVAGSSGGGGGGTSVAVINERIMFVR